MKRPLHSLAALALVVLLSGCSQSDGKKAGDSLKLGNGSTVDLTGGPTQAGKGSIVGVVVDEAIRPIGHANLTVGAAGLNTTSDETGVFHFDDLAPGSYTIAATAGGFVSVQSSVDVVAGEVAHVRLLMPIDSSPQPYYTTYTHDGYMQAWGGIGQFAAEELLTNGSGLCDCRVYFTPDGNVTTLIYEAYWTYTLPDPAQQAKFYWVVEEPSGNGLSTGYCFSPCVNRINYDADGFKAGTEAYARLDGPDTAVAFQQTFKLFLTVWNNGPAPAGWTAVSAT